MEFYETTAGRLGMRDIAPVLAGLLRQIPSSGDCDSDELEERFFPIPTADPDEHDLREDWKAHVEPELHGLFQSSRQTVEADLRGMKEDEEGTFLLEFSSRHAEAWLNALNQARIALVSRHGIEENEMSGPYPHEINTERDLALLKIYFYEHILHWLVEIVDA